MKHQNRYTSFAKLATAPSLMLVIVSLAGCGSSNPKDEYFPSEYMYRSQGILIDLDSAEVERGVGERGEVRRYTLTFFLRFRDYKYLGAAWTTGYLESAEIRGVNDRPQDQGIIARNVGLGKTQSPWSDGVTEIGKEKYKSTLRTSWVLMEHTPKCPCTILATLHYQHIPAQGSRQYQVRDKTTLVFPGITLQ
jgi:hypothetical protein